MQSEAGALDELIVKVFPQSAIQNVGSNNEVTKLKGNLQTTSRRALTTFSAILDAGISVFAPGSAPVDTKQYRHTVVRVR